MKRRVFLCEDADVQDDIPKKIRVTELDGDLALYRVEGQYFLTDDLCTHGLASLSAGELDGTNIVCPLHGGAFDIRTGNATEYPCKRPLRTYPVEVEDGRVYGILT